MKITVAELIEKIENGSLHTEQTTQREFIYDKLPPITVAKGVEVTKAALVIRSILEFRMQLPALYFWRVVDKDITYPEDEYELLDGKQRTLSIYNFVMGNTEGYVNGRCLRWDDLTEADQDYLLDYEFDVTVMEGTQEQEEETFLTINSSSVPLTQYENVRGCYYGQFFTEFENYITSYKKAHPEFDKELVEIGRGEQAIWFLYQYFELLDYSSKDKMFAELRKELAANRNKAFDETYKSFEQKLEVYLTLKRDLNKLPDSSKKPLKMHQISAYIVSNNWDVNICKGYYTWACSSVNDISSWNIQTHEKALEMYMSNPQVKLDGRRNFDRKDTLANLLKKSNKCAICRKALKFDTAEIDHIIPWSKGGQTIENNAQLLCKPCNAAKGAKI